MQQTENLKLNLIETGDPISPVPLNENMDKIEAALLTKTGAAETAALAQRVVELEKFRFTSSTYIGDGIEGSIRQIGFTPAALFLWALTPRRVIMLTGDMVSPPGYAEIVPGGFKLKGTDTNSHNCLNYQYAYAAFGLNE